MQNFSDFNTRKRALLQAYETVLRSDILPVDETGPAQLEERRKDLEDGRFLVAVCGRIKAGKSTLLNALLFQDWVMPTDDMPLTAKNTLVEYGERQALEVTFFNLKEWNALTAQLHAGDLKVQEEFFAEVRQAEGCDVRERDWIKAEGRVERFDSLADLRKFVTPVERGGIFTPFVKAVKVIHPHPWLRLVSIADTPGVDDPYKFREDQTRRFVTRADAVLFVTYAGQAMSQPDFDFLNEYLIHVPPERRLIAVNKADLLRRGSADVDAYLRDLMDSPEPAIRSVFGKRDSVRMVSALGGLIAQTELAGREVPEEYVWSRNQLDKSGHLDAGANGIDALRLLVEERLVGHQGASIIDGHARFLVSLFERKRRQAKAALTLDLGRLDDLSQTQEQLREQIGAIETEMKAMERSLNAAKKVLLRDCVRLLTRLERAFGKAHTHTMENTNQTLSAETQIDTLGKRASWIFLENFDIERVMLEDALNECVEAIEESVKGFSETLRAGWSHSSSAPFLDDVLSVSTGESLHSLRALRTGISSVEQLDKLREDSTVFYQRWFNTGTGRARAVSAILDPMNKQLQAGLEGKSDEVKKQLNDELQKTVLQIETRLQGMQQGRLDDKEKLTKGHHDRSMERAAKQAEIEAGQARLTTLAALEAEVKAQVAAA